MYSTVWNKLVKVGVTDKASGKTLQRLIKHTLARRFLHGET